jgi:hypothetical protein
MMRKLLGIVFMAMTVIGTTPAMAASGLKSTAGQDYSQDHNAIQQVRACDEESDSHGVHADYTTIGSSINQQVRDGGGANNGCASTGVYSQKIYKHRIVEEVNASPDEFGVWKYPS